MIRIFLCDDDSNFIDHSVSLILEYTRSILLEVEIRTFKDGGALIHYLDNNNVIPDIIFMDIFMESVNGIETIKEVRRRSMDPIVIFLTVSPDFIFEAFDLKTFNYLIKQETNDLRYIEILKQALQHSKITSSGFFSCSFGSESLKVQYRLISYFEIFGRVMRVHYGNGEYFDFYENMDSLSKRLHEHGFVRIHRSYLINVNSIVKFHEQTVLLADGFNLSIGKAYLKELQEAFHASYLGK